MIKKLEFNTQYPVKDEMFKVFANQLELAEKLNEVIDQVNKPVTFEMSYKQNDTDKTLKQCLKYCAHRIKYHPESGLAKIISQGEFVALCRKYRVE